MFYSFFGPGMIPLPIVQSRRRSGPAVAASRHGGRYSGGPTVPTGDKLLFKTLSKLSASAYLPMLAALFPVQEGSR